MTTSILIKEQREKLNLTLKEIATFVGVSEGTVSRWESGEIKNMKRNKIAKLSQILQISPLELTGISTNEEIEEFTNHEKRVIRAYRNKPEMQPAVDKLLGVENTDALTEDMKNTADKINFPIKQK